MLAFHLARFKVDATPPTGHPLCGGWIKPVVGVDDPQWLRGVVLMGAGMPVVLASLDWTGVMNESHRLWTEALAAAAHTTPDRVALHCVHQHNAPFIDRDGNALLRKAGAPSLLYDEPFVEGLVRRSADAVRESLTAAQPVTHVHVGTAEVKQVASNRRVIGPNGKIRFSRTSATKDPAARAEPEGTIDPVLKSIGFFGNDRPLARLYYYTTHPMSYYGDGRVSSDFVGIARERRDAEEADTLHLYFTGSAGNVTAGKYNDGSHENRAVLAGRVHAAMSAADRDADGHRRRLETITWTTAPILFAPREDLDLEALKAIVADPAADGRQPQPIRDDVRLADARRHEAPDPALPAPARRGRRDPPPVGNLRRVSTGRATRATRHAPRDRGLRRRGALVHPARPFLRRGGL